MCVGSAAGMHARQPARSLRLKFVCLLCLRLALFIQNLSLAEVDDNRPEGWPTKVYSVLVTPAIEGAVEHGDDFERELESNVYTCV